MQHQVAQHARRLAALTREQKRDLAANGFVAEIKTLPVAQAGLAGRDEVSQPFGVGYCLSGRACDHGGAPRTRVRQAFGHTPPGKGCQIACFGKIRL